MTYHYQPSPFMLPTSHYDEKKADRAVAFIQNLKHTKGKWAGKPFLLLPWQEQIIRDLFGIVKEDGNRQFLSAYVEIPKKNGKSELASLRLLYIYCMRMVKPVQKFMEPPVIETKPPLYLMLLNRWLACLIH